MYPTTTHTANLTPSQRAAFNRADYQLQQQRARAVAKSENDKRDREQATLEKKADETLSRLVDGKEVQTFDDMEYLVNLYFNKGDEDGKYDFLRMVDNHTENLRRAAVAKVEREVRIAAKEVEQRFFKYVQMKDKRDTKRVVESFRGTPFEAISQAIYDASPKRPSKEKEEAATE